MSLLEDVIVRVATCNLNQWAMDFELNKRNIIASLEECVRVKATYRTGPEQEICGYSCEDHFFESDTELHCWDVLAELLAMPEFDGLLYDLGMPVTHKGTRYNCRVWVLNGFVLGIRPKLVLANDGNYRETRWFTGWNRGSLASFFQGTEPTELDNDRKEFIQDDSMMCEVDSNLSQMDWFSLPSVINIASSRNGTRQGSAVCPIGVFIVEHNNTMYASEVCEELFMSARPSNILFALGTDVVSNGSGSHHELRKFHTRQQLISSAAVNGVGCYVYSNLRGCDGNRLYFDGSSCIFTHEGLQAQAAQFHVVDTQVVFADVNVSSIRRARAKKASFHVQGQSLVKNFPLPVIKVSKVAKSDAITTVSVPRLPTLYTPEEEIAYSPACWLWDYLRRSGAGGFFQPLSGGADSASTAAIVGFMCRIVAAAYNKQVPIVCSDVNKLFHGKAPASITPQELCHQIFFTTYMGTSNSSQETRDRARALASDLGSQHLDMNIDGVVSACVDAFSQATNFTPKFTGDYRENLALQNIQARVRMVQSYLQAQLLQCAAGRPGMLLVLGSANVDEALRGFLTKYDCSSADINPIGGICKLDLRLFLNWATATFPAQAPIAAAKATPELVPATVRPDGTIQTQVSEEDMGLTFQELGVMARLRKIHCLGPVAMYKHLVRANRSQNITTGAQEDCLFSNEPTNTLTPSSMTPESAAELVKKFMRLYALNRHKSTVLTPALHAENYSPDDNRFDLRQFLYNIRWTYQFKQIDALVQQHTNK